jgi:hypothetical protein
MDYLEKATWEFLERTAGNTDDQKRLDDSRKLWEEDATEGQMLRCNQTRGKPETKDIYLGKQLKSLLCFAD